MKDEPRRNLRSTFRRNLRCEIRRTSVRVQHNVIESFLRKNYVGLQRNSSSLPAPVDLSRLNVARAAIKSSGDAIDFHRDSTFADVSPAQRSKKGDTWIRSAMIPIAVSRSRHYPIRAALKCRIEPRALVDTRVIIAVSDDYHQRAVFIARQFLGSVPGRRFRCRKPETRRYIPPPYRKRTRRRSREMGGPAITAG